MVYTVEKTDHILRSLGEHLPEYQHFRETTKHRKDEIVQVTHSCLSSRDMNTVWRLLPGLPHYWLLLFSESSLLLDPL